MRALTFLICGFLATACVDDRRDVRGELGEVVFSYVCVDSTDYQCLDETRGMPDTIGVDGRFDLEEDELFSSREDIYTASRQMVERSSQGFTWKKAGYAAILIFERSGDIEDFFHLKGANVDFLNVLDEESVSTTTVKLLEGERVVLHVRPETGNGTVLGGAFSYEWRSGDETVVQVMPGASNKVGLLGTGVGNARVTVTLKQLSTSVRVEVDTNPTRLDEAGIPDSATIDEYDADTDDDAGSDEDAL